MSAKSVCDMSCGAMHEFALVLDKAGFDAALAQRIVNSKGNKLAAAMFSAVSGLAETDDRFELVNSFGIVVPRKYDHKTRMSTFGAKHRSEFIYYNDGLTDENFGNATTVLAPGRKLKVKVIQVKKTVTSIDCLAYLRSQRAVLVGAQGASIVYEQARKKLPVDRWCVSFDEKDTLPVIDGCHGVPGVSRVSGGGFEFYLGSFEAEWGGGFCLLCFCD